MNLHDLHPAAGSTKTRKCKGRGMASGNGKTGGRGHKGQHARSGGKVRVGFEGFPREASTTFSLRTTLK